MNRPSPVHGVWIPLLYALLLLPLFFLHDTFEEWDGVIQFFAGREILTGSGYNGWASHFWPPLYPLLVGLGNLFIHGFAAAKLVSAVSSILLLYVAYEIAVELSNEKTTGLLTQLFLCLNPLYVLSSLQAENHMLDSFFFVSGLLFLLKSLKEKNAKTLLATGLLCGLAGLSRYTSYALVPTSLIVLMLILDLKKAIRLSLVFVLGFALVSLPWWYYNTLANGSPLHTWQYMNIGAAVVPKIEGKQEWWWSTQSRFNGILGIVSAMPLAYLRNFARNVISSSKLLLMSAGVLVPFALPAVFASVIKLKRNALVALVGLTSMYIVVVSQAFVFEQVFLSWTVIMTSLSVMFLLDYVDSCEKRYAFLKRCRCIVWVIACLSVAGSILTFYRIVPYISDKSDGGQLADSQSVTKALREHDPNIETKFIMAIHPARAYYVGAKYLMIPLYYEGSLDGLVTYEGMSERVKTYAQKYPSTIANSKIRADYVIYDINVKRCLPQFAFLLDPSSKKVPRNFKVVYRSGKVVVYEVVWR